MTRPDSAQILAREQLDALFEALADEGFDVVGPTIRDQAIIYDHIAGVDDLPVGWTDEQEAATYRLRRRGDEAVFGYNVGPTAWKRFLRPPRQTLVGIERGDDGSVRFEPAPIPQTRYAFVGVRSCDLSAIGVLDRVLTQDRYEDVRYAARRASLFVVTVNCADAGGTCFCASMGTGPRAPSGFDVAITEVLEPAHHFVLEAGSNAGRALIDRLPTRAASADEHDAVDEICAQTTAKMGRHLETDGIREMLQDNPEHPRWDDVAQRCLTCTNCTLVCPTCFCTSVEDSTDLSGAHARREQRWDSCFTMDFSYVHGGSVRTTNKARYRQWMTHKLSTWYDQFGSSGCVGCGRCITWCPVGIDITEEAAAIRATTETNYGGGAHE